MEGARIAGAAVLLAVCLSASGAFAGADGAARIAASAGIGDAPTKVADALGHFNPPGASPPIAVDYASSGKQALGRLLAGEVEFALAAPTPLAAALLSDDGSAPPAEVVILASVSLTADAHHVIAAADRGIGEPGHLAGRRVAVMRGTSAHFGWSRFAAFHGLAPGSVTLVDVAIDEQDAALASGAVDAVVTWEPWASAILETLGARAAHFSTRRLYSLDWLLLTRRDLARARPALVDRVLGGYLAAVDLIERDPERARAAHARLRGLPDALLARLEEGVIFRIVLDWAVVAQMETRLGWLLEQPEWKGAARPQPRTYLEAAPMLRLAPRRVGLPGALHGGGGAIAGAP